MKEHGFVILCAFAGLAIGLILAHAYTVGTLETVVDAGAPFLDAYAGGEDVTPTAAPAAVSPADAPSPVTP